MTARAFFCLVEKMRQAEKDNEERRSPMTYSRTKSLQAQVDAEIARVNAIINQQQPQQQTLFES